MHVEMPFNVFAECLHELDIGALTEVEFDFKPFPNFNAIVFNLADFVNDSPFLRGEVSIDVIYDFEKGDDENPGVMDVRMIDIEGFRKQFKRIADEVLLRAIFVYGECLQGRVSQILFYQLQKDCELYIYEKASGEIADINYEKACEG